MPEVGAGFHDVEVRDLPDPEEIREQLRSILASPAFHGSKRCQRFLEYVCERFLAGEAGALKERTIAIEVFGRNPQSDLGEDTIVRVGAREVRKRLAQFYVMPEAAASRVRIDLPPGSYVPKIRYAERTDARAGGRKWGLGVILALGFVPLAALAVYAVARLSIADPGAEPFRRFWEPVLQSSGPMLLAVGHPIVYHPSSRAVRKSEERLPPMAVPAQRPIQLPPEEVDGSDMVPVFNQYVGFGDMVAGLKVAAMLASQSKDSRVRLASEVQFADLRQAQTLLIGAITNRWTMELEQGWRFQFARTADFKTAIVDTADPNRRQWSIPSRDDGSAPEDYIVISRVTDSPAGGLIMVAAGLKQFGTEAAGRLLTDPGQLSLILNKLPAGWEAKNLQIVLHARVIGNTPARPAMLAWHVW